MKNLLVILLLQAAPVTFAQFTGYSVDTVRINSLILQEDRTILIYRPVNLKADIKLNIIYLLDGENVDYYFHAIQAQPDSNRSDLLAVGIVNTNRRRDMLYVNGAGKFLKFITSELEPVMENRFTTGSRILFGHSFAGAFTIYALLNQPNAFDGYIASSPAPIMALTNLNDYLKTDSTVSREKILHLSYGSKDMRQVIKWARELNDNLTGTEFKHLIWELVVYEDRDHNNTTIPALTDGLDYVLQSSSVH